MNHHINSLIGLHCIILIDRKRKCSVLLYFCLDLYIYSYDGI